MNSHLDLLYLVWFGFFSGVVEDNINLGLVVFIYMVCDLIKVALYFYSSQHTEQGKPGGTENI